VTVEAHAQAFLTLLDADNTAPALVVLDGEVPQGTLPPYVLVYTSLRVPGADVEPDKSSLGFDSIAARGRAICHSVGGNAIAARTVATRVRTALLDVTPTVASRTCTPIRWVDGQDAQRDEQTGAPVFDQVDVYEFTSTPG